MYIFVPNEMALFYQFVDVLVGLLLHKIAYLHVQDLVSSFVPSHSSYHHIITPRLLLL